MKFTTEQSKRIQILRGVAIIAVVFIHNTPTGLAQVFCRPFLNFSVGLFLFLSGMLSNASNWNPKKRIIKVLIPYVLWTFIYSVMYNIDNPVSIPIVFAKNVLTGKAAAVMYYIFVYCEFTILIPLIDRLAKSKFKYCGLLIAPIEIVIMRSMPLIAGLEINKYISVIIGISCLGWFTYFYLGYLVGNKLLSINMTNTKIMMLWIISILFQIAEGFYYYTLGYENCGTQLKLTSIISGALFALMAYNYVIYGKTRNVKVLELLGNNSFGIYFSHLAVMAVVHHIPMYNRYVTYPITAVITIVLTIFCVLLGKRLLGKQARYLAL
ncbi:MAG: acyltransferase [Acutalibacteraceae bacterium]